MAYKLVDAVLATSPVLAGVRFALVDVAETAGVEVSSGAFAPETVHQVDADPAVGAGIWSTFVDVDFTMFSDEAGNALAFVAEISKTVVKYELIKLQQIQFVCLYLVQRNRKAT